MNVGIDLRSIASDLLEFPTIQSSHFPVQEGVEEMGHFVEPTTTYKAHMKDAHFEYSDLPS